MTWAIRQTPVLFPRSRDFQCSVSSFFYQPHSRWVSRCSRPESERARCFLGVSCFRMRNAIIEKLRRHLAGPVDSECKVVYLLCEIRKLLEAHKHDARWFTLRLHCHWALHVDLVYSGTTLPFLRKVDRYVKTWDEPSARIVMDQEGNTISCEIPDVDPVFDDFVYLATFRKELAQFLDTFGLATTVCDDDMSWSRFLTAYAGVIEMVPLSAKPRGARLTPLR